MSKGNKEVLWVPVKGEGKTVIRAAAIKVMSPAPKNVIVCMPVIKNKKILGQLQSDHMTQEEADELVAVVNAALSSSRE